MFPQTYKLVNNLNHDNEYFVNEIMKKKLGGTLNINILLKNIISQSIIQYANGY